MRWLTGYHGTPPRSEGDRRGSGSSPRETTNALLLNALLLSSAFILVVVAFVGDYVLRTFSLHARGPLCVVRERREATARLGAREGSPGV